ncbi:MAG: glycosyltransferase family 2 protein [Candidatus Micrarchaeota archaeon]|nr:glycosyltransferase family 2 protein [Candidatus Micrarchaeota archaeon]
MFMGKRITVVMPAYNAERTLKRTYREVKDTGIVDRIIVVDDGSNDGTARVAGTLNGVNLIVHERNMGYGANQKTCYSEALKGKTDIVIMIHADYQYTPKLIPAIASLIIANGFDCVLASRILGGKATEQGMPYWKYLGNRILTLSCNVLTGAKLSEYHTGYRAFTAELLRELPIRKNSDDFVFDIEMLLEIIGRGKNIGEIGCPTKYFDEASSIKPLKSMKYGYECLREAAVFWLCRSGVIGRGRLAAKYLGQSRRVKR